MVTAQFAAAIERLGYGALWLGASPGGDLAIVDDILDATTTLTVATGVVNMWQADAVTVAESFARIDGRHPGRFLLGVGVGHREATQEYAKPYEKATGYLTTLIGAGVPGTSVVLAALGPKMLRLAADQTAGAHPYLVTPEYTRWAREIAGAQPLLAVEHKVVLETDDVAARAVGRPRVRTPYLGLANYTANLRRLGWTDADLADGGSDALVDALVAHGSAGQVAARLGEHLAAGADHVCVQLLSASDTGSDDPSLIDGYRELAQALGL